MPVYEYQCAKHGVFDHEQKISHELLTKNVGLVYSVVQTVGVEPSAAVYDDCVQEGMIALAKAAERFRPNYGDGGVPFSSFAWRWIDGAVKTCLCRGSVVSEPLKKVRKRAADSARGRGSERAHAPVVPFPDLDAPRPGSASLRADEGARRRVTLPECLIDRHAEDTVAEQIDERARRERLRDAIDALPRDQRRTIQAALRGATVGQIARRHGYGGHGWGRGQVAALLEQAIETLRAALSGSGPEPAQ